MAEALRVLVVEDETDIGDWIRLVLERAGHTVDLHPSGRDVAAGHVEADGYDVAVVDLRMPEVDGVEVLAWLARHAPDVRRLVFTASPPVANDLTVYVEQVLCKPLTGDELRDAVEAR